MFQLCGHGSWFIIVYKIYICLFERLELLEDTLRIWVLRTRKLGGGSSVTAGRGEGGGGSDPSRATLNKAGEGDSDDDDKDKDDDNTGNSTNSRSSSSRISTAFTPVLLLRLLLIPLLL